MALARPKKIRLGDLLVEHQVITQEQLSAALETQQSSGHKLGRVLIDQGYLSEEQLMDFLARQLNIDYIDVRRREVKPDTVRLIPEVQARRFRVIALEEDPEGVLIGMADPTNIFAYDEVARIVQRPLKLAVVKEADLLKAIDTVYRRTTEISGFAAQLEQQMSANDGTLANRALADAIADAPVVRLLQTMFEDAVQVNASDIHIEPEEHDLRIRFRIDGVMQVQTTAERRIADALLSRLKLMAKLDISEKRVPQDGRFHIHIQDKNVDVRLSTLPVEFGESAVMRLLNQSAGILDLAQLGIPGHMLTRLRRLIHSPHGLVLVTGPTGSGKTTTLYSMLKELNNPSVKIITVEDPVEYRLPGVNQVQVNTKIDLSFARVLRSMLRQDPDIVLVGEMRDAETASIGLRTSMTGHLVLSTLHTNDAISSTLRLVDMGAEPYLIAGALRGVLSQRLVRRICENCTEPEPLDTNTQILLGHELGGMATEITFMRGKGCTYCNDSGYHGRIGIYELMEISGELAEALHNNDLTSFARLAVQQPGYQSLRHSAIQLAAQGLTTVDEVVRVSFGMED